MSDVIEKNMRHGKCHDLDAACHVAWPSLRAEKMDFGKQDVVWDTLGAVEEDWRAEEG